MLRHKNFVSLLGYCEDSDEKFFVYEYIPSSLVAFPALRIVDVSNKNLRGVIPEFKKYVKFIYKPENHFLKHKSRKSISVAIVIGTSVGASLVILAIIGLVVWMCKFRKTTTTEIEDVSSASIVSDAIVESGHEDRKGGSSVVYRGEHSQCGLIVVKRVDSKAIAERMMNEFKIEVDVLTKLGHKNLVSILGYCEDNDENFIVYEYMLQERWHNIYLTGEKFVLLL
ncbi:unnamed protein product [Arabis nemorensis]|uniref:Protein kinase domain-containing protein n=1 Tax=Arabis nemorensis TaxID=586526 RepID=A0A565ATX2_9BRAS|nr:unnamed protein product [Arabis nemorensis]